MPFRKRSSYPKTFCDRSKIGWRATKRCPGSASAFEAEDFLLAGASFTILISALPLRNFNRDNAGNHGFTPPLPPSRRVPVPENHFGNVGCGKLWHSPLAQLPVS